MKFVKIDSIEALTDREYVKYMSEKNSADLAYIAMMTDVDMPVEESTAPTEEGE